MNLIKLIKLIKLVRLGKLLILTALLSFCSFSQAKTFTFTAIPDQDQAQLRKRFNQVADYLSKELDIEVKYIPVKSYAAAITAFRNNQVQLAWFGGLSGVRARQLVPGSEAIAQGVEDQHFVTYFIAHHSTGLKSSQEFPKSIQGQTFTFGSKGSTSGRLMPEFYIRQNLQQAPRSLFKAVGFSGDHTLTINQVQSGAYQVGAVNFQVWEKMLADGKIDLDKVSVIWKTPEYPDYQWTIRADVERQFGKEFKQKVTQTLLNMNSPELLSQFPRSGFIKASNQDYDPIKQTAIQLGLIEKTDSH
jgi:phosphonate transport system substrate-binding protein